MSANPYIRIMKAAEKGTGVHLTADECHYLSLDSSIAAVAAITSEGGESDGGWFVVTKRAFIDTSSMKEQNDKLHEWSSGGVCHDCGCAFSGLSRVDPCPGRAPSPQSREEPTRAGEVG